jgi:hypothetical protein
MNNIFIDFIFPILLSIAMILWFYCLWFLNKYDRNTNRLIMLLILNIYYMPFYLFRIRRIKKEYRIKAIAEDIYDSGFIKMSRSSIIGTLELWTSKERQLESQETESDVNLSQELFQQWGNVYRIDSRIIEEAFSELENEFLKTFDETVITSYEKFGDSFPDINKFQKTNDWKVLNQLAIEIIKEIK